MNDLTASLQSMTALAKLKYENDYAEIWAEIQKAEALLEAVKSAFALKQDLLASLRVMIALTKFKYTDPLVWEEIQKAEEVYDTVLAEQYPVG